MGLLAECGMGAMMGMKCAIHQTILLALIVLGLGFVVGEKAKKSEACCKCGNIISWVMMIGAILVLVCTLWCGWNCMSGKSCPASNAPMMEQSAMPAAQ